MAIKNRILSKLKSAYVMLNMASATHPQKMHPVYSNLVEARNLCQQGLTASNFAKYGEIYDGLIMASKQVLDGTAGSEAGKIVNLGKELLQHIVRETSQEEKFKKEMVFLPYKYSMWDSLESVWRAAYEDEDNCIAYVIPIPYCNRNADGSVRKWHCEREYFPADIPTLDWQEVDLRTMHPDVIFYHYPYDNRNLVTSPDSSYHSSNLKKCTDKLVYIPYFTLGEPQYDYNDPEKAEEVKEAEDGWCDYILEPGVVNADLSIVQSEAVKRVYVNVLTRYTDAPREYWEEHIQGWGSPKYDKVASSKREDFELPEEWLNIIRGRKTILYNTCLVSLLKHADKYMEKVRSVLATFKAQKDVVLWWRPHPLFRSTLESMHPDLLAEYDDIVRKYRSEGWGIFDDTADMNRSIACTDGYYGDWSSVVQLYEKTGKMIMIQHIEDSEKNVKE